MKNKELAEELNRKMRLDEIINLEQKPIPYLGWYWRDINDWEVDSLSVSFTDGYWWLDEAGKWSYPSKRLNKRESRQFLILCNQIVDRHIKLMKILQDPEMKESLHKQRNIKDQASNQKETKQ